jgi:hypothetical protein
MKKMIIALAIVIFLFSFVATSAESADQRYCYGRWVLYDNFNRGVIDENKWDIDTSSATITIENGEARFDHDLSKPNDSSWLIFKKYPERIKAVMVTIRVATDAVDQEDLRARIGGFIGRDSESNYLWTALQVRNRFERIDCWTGAFETTSSQDFLYEAFFAFFERPIPIVNENHTVTMYFSQRELKYSALGLGTISHVIPEWLNKTDDFFKGIGTRSSVTASGTGVVYFDNVYVMY